MGKFIDLTGQTFERLKVVERDLTKRGVYWICECKCGKTKSFETERLNAGLQSCGCLKSELTKERNNINRIWKYNINEIITNAKVDVTITDRFIQNKKKHYKYACNKCGYNGIVNEFLLFKGQGCACCASRIVVEGINDIVTTTPWMVEYFVNPKDSRRYTYYSSKKILMRCLICKNQKNVIIGNLYRNHSISCPYCSDSISYPEKFMMSVLGQLHIKYEREFSPDWLVRNDNKKSKCRFDFKLLDYPIIIEMDGSLGHGKKQHSKNSITLMESILIDNWKDTQAKLNGYIVYRINSDESEIDFLRNNIINILNDIVIFDFNKVDWLKADIDAQRNIANEVVEYYNSNKPIFTCSIAEHFNISINTVCKYLNKANKQGRCDFDGSLNMKLGRIKANQKSVNVMKKEIHVYKNNKYLGAYSSVSELCRQSIIDFGVSFSESCVSSVALNKLPHHKKYIFSYTKLYGEEVA